MPAENVHSHIPHRLFRSTNPDSSATISITGYKIQERKGEDFDGDVGYLHGLSKRTGSPIDALRNQALLLMANDYANPAFWTEIHASVAVQDVFSELAKKYAKKEAQRKRAGKVYSNTLQGELHAHAVNSTSKRSLSAVAAGGKLWDYSQALGFELTERIEGLVLYGSGKNAVKLNYSKASVRKMSPKQKILRKLYYQTALVNLTVDDPSHPTMYKLNINEITAPMVQALIVLNDSAKTEKEIKSHIERIVTFLKSPLMVQYVDTLREMEGVNFIMPQNKEVKMVQDIHGRTREDVSFTDKTKRQNLVDTLESNHSKEKVDNLMEFHNLIQEARDYSSMLGAMYEAPADYAEHLQNKAKYQDFINDRGRYLSTASAQIGTTISPHFAALENVINYLDSHAFTENVLNSDVGRQIIANAPSRMNETAIGLRKIQRITNRALMVSSMQFGKYMAPDRMLASLIERIEDPEYSNRFTELLTKAGQLTETADSRRIEIAEKYRYTDIPVDVLEAAREDFDLLPHSLKQAFALYNYQVYGTSGSTFSGSFSSLFGPQFSQWINQRVVENIEAFEKEEAPLLVDQIENLIRKPSLMNWNGNFFKGDMLEAMSMKELERPTQSASAGSIQSRSHSLREFHTVVSARSPLLFSGARGLHKAFMKHLDNLEADQYNARIKRERWEIKTKARKSFNREEKATPTEKKLGEDMLAAAIALIEGTEDVIVGFDTVDMGFIEAYQIRREQIQKKFPEYWSNTKANEKDLQEIENFRRSVKNYGLTVQANMTVAQAKEHLLYARMIKWMRANKRKTFPIRQAIIDSRTAEEIAKQYDAKVEDWMLTSSQLVNEITTEFERVRQRMNTDMIGNKAEWIKKRENYVPHYYFVENSQEAEDVALREIEQPEELSRIKKRSYDSYIEAAEVGNLMPSSTNAAELYERWMKETAHTKFREVAWGVLLMGAAPNGTVSMLPVVNREMYDENKEVLFPKAMLDALANRIAFSTNQDWKPGDNAIEFLGRQQPSEEDYELMDTGIASIPQVWVRKDQTRNIVKMIINDRHKGKGWELWERLNAWTKFMAIGFPYMSYFHKAALLESAIAMKGIKESPAWSPIANYKNFKEFRKELLNNPELAEWWIRRGLQAKNTHPDYAQGVVNKDLETARDRLATSYPGLSKSVDKFIDVKKTWDNHLWQDFHTPLKIWLAEGEMQQRRVDAIEAGYELNEDLVAREIAAKVDDALGGQQFQRNLWATPKVQQALHNVFFAYDWTISALGIAGIKNIPGMKNVFGFESPITNDIMYRKYWPAFAAIILFGIPNAMQAAIWALTRPVGDDDDMPFTFLNEHDRASWVDITPLLRLTAPLPVIGYDGGKTGERRVYLRWGKQAYEVFEGWLQHPVKTLGHKTSMTVKTAFEQITGRSMGGWELAFKDAGLMGALEAQGSFWKGRVGNVAQKFTPFLIQDIIKGKPTAWFAKAKSGKSEFYATKQLAGLYLGYTQSGKWDVARNHQANVLALGSAIIDAAYENGYNGGRAHDKALAEVRVALYAQMLEELKAGKYKKVEITAQKILAMNGVAKKIEKFIAKKS